MNKGNFTQRYELSDKEEYNIGEDQIVDILSVNSQITLSPRHAGTKNGLFKY